MKKTANVMVAIVSPIMIEGDMACTGDVVEVTAAEAANYARRKKARLATEDDLADAEGAE